MAVVLDWQQPLEEALLNALNSNELTVGALEEAHRVLSMLDSSSDGIARIRSLLDQKADKLDEDYRKAVENIEAGPSQHTVQQGIDTLKRIGGYKEAADKIRLGEERLRQLAEEAQRREEALARARRKKRRIAVFTAAAVVILIAVFFKINSDQYRQQVNELKMQVQSLIDGGSPREIIPLLNALDDKNVSSEELYSLSEAALEQTARQEGFAAAFDWEEELERSARYAVKSDAFFAWANGQLSAGTLSVQEGWDVAVYAMERDRLPETDPGVLRAYNASLEDAVAKAGPDSDADIKALLDPFSPYFTKLAADPDTALRLCSALEQQGQDPAAVFPDGIAVSVPVGASVGSFTSSVGESKAAPNTSRFLPVSIVEQTGTSFGLEMFNQIYTNESRLKEDITKLQSKDSHYKVFLLPQYLKLIPEESRAESFAECTCLVAMQQSYMLSGYTYTIKSTSGKYSRSYTSTGYSNYRGYFDAIASTVFYDLREPDRFALIHADQAKPVIASSGWYEKNKNNSSFLLYTAENSLGKHDVKKLKENYDVVIGNLRLYQLLIAIDSGDQGGGDSGQDTQETEMPAVTTPGGDGL